MFLTGTSVFLQMADGPLGGARRAGFFTDHLFNNATSYMNHSDEQEEGLHSAEDTSTSCYGRFYGLLRQVRLLEKVLQALEGGSTFC
ncbi:hypothetical protein AMECASPLE_028539 [Ameca splendens]|uniref:Uncharacterized protein n=1 Tax=Ameca splendens TaxID=208324 RepID=A0ABV1A431_9TELE